MQSLPYSGAMLELADAWDRALGQVRRTTLHSQAAVARAARGKAPIATIRGPASAHEVARDGRLARLLHYPAAVGATGRAPILIVASLINRFYVLDLLPDLSVIGLLGRHGHPVYVLDWKAPGSEGPSLRFADYVDGAIAGAARDVARIEGGLPHVIGYCMGGTMAAMFAARHPTRLRSLALLGAPIDFHRSGILAGWTRPELFDADLVIDALGNLPPALMQSGFKLMNPFDALAKLRGLFRDADDEDRVRHFVALEAWLDDNLAFPGGVYREYIRGLYQDNALVRGEFRIAGEPVDLGRISAPLLNVIALRDHICEPPASRALMPLVSSTERRAIEFDTGHIGLTTSRRAHRELWPAIAAWLAEQD